MSRRTRILVAGLNYAPETTGIAPYTHGMVRALAEDHDVEVVTALPHYPQWAVHDGYSGWRTRERLDGVGVTRLRHYVPGDPTGVSRIVSEASFAARLATARLPRPDLVVAVTPALLPLAPLLGRARRWGVPTGVVVQDLYGKAASELGLLGGRGSGAVPALESRLLQSADGVVSIHERMARAIRDDCGVAQDRVTVIRNWTHIDAPTAEREQTRAALGWSGDHVVLHAGNMGAKQGLDHVVAAARLADAERADVRFVLMGAGAVRVALGEAARDIACLELMDPVDGDRFADVLAAADTLLLHERPGLKEMCAPSKLTSYFAAARPVLAATDVDSAAAHEVEVSGAGLVVPSGDPAALLAGLEKLRAEPDPEALGRRGADYARGALSEEVAFTAYREWAARLLARRP